MLKLFLGISIFKSSIALLEYSCLVMGVMVFPASTTLELYSAKNNFYTFPVQYS